MLKYAIYDPSYSRESGYWQWHELSEPFDASSWTSIAHSIQQGLPKKEEGLFGQTQPTAMPQLWGCIRKTGNSLFVYRFYITGRDSFGRPGRFFFIVFQLSSASELETPEAKKMLAYLETQKSMPIVCKKHEELAEPSGGSSSLTEAIFSASPESPSPLDRIIRLVGETSVASHHGWVIGRDGSVETYTDLPYLGSSAPPLPEKRNPNPPHLPPKKPENPSKPLADSRHPLLAFLSEIRLKKPASERTVKFLLKTIAVQFGLILILVLVVLFSFSKCSNLQRQNKELERQNKELRQKKEQPTKDNSRPENPGGKEKKGKSPTPTPSPTSDPPKDGDPKSVPKPKNGDGSTPPATP